MKWSRMTDSNTTPGGWGSWQWLVVAPLVLIGAPFYFAWRAIKRLIGGPR